MHIDERHDKCTDELLPPTDVNDKSAPTGTQIHMTTLQLPQQVTMLRYYILIGRCIV